MPLARHKADMTNRSEGPRVARSTQIAVAALGVLPAVLPAAAGAQDLRYNLTPTAEQVSWDDALGLDNTLLYGGRLGVVFGRRIELQGFYLTNQGADAKIGDLYDRLGVSNPPQNPGLGLRNYGASVVYNFALGGFTPFLRGGGSVLRFAPSGGDHTDRVAFNYGGGLRFGKPGGLRFNVFAEDLRFRIDRTLLAPLLPGTAPLPPDPDADKLRHNLTYGAGLSVPLGKGAATYDDTPQYQLGNVALPIDVFAARQDFADASGLPRQNVVGVRTGIDFGPLFGLRGFYWRGVNDDFNRRQGVQGYGGEAQFALNAGPGLNPFVVAGAAQVDFLDSYNRTTPSGIPIPPPADQTALVLGGGVKIPVGARFVLTAAARDYLAAVGGVRTQDAAEASQLRSNWQYSVGLSFGLGGRGARRRAVAAVRRDTVFVERADGRVVEVRGARDTTVVRLADRAAVERATVVERYAVTARGDTLRGTAADSALAADRTTRLVEVRRVDDRPVALGTTFDGAPGAANGYATGRTVAVPVPAEGEIIVRYGPQRAPAGAGPLVVGPPVAPYAAAAAPARTLQREYRDRDNRVVREYREGDGTISREFTDDRGRPIREYRDASGRVIREYITVPSASTGTVVVPQYVPQGAPQYAPQYVVPQAAPQPAPQYYAQPAPASPPPAPQYVPGYEPVAPGTDADARGLVTKERRNGVVARPSSDRAAEVEARVSARLDSLERAVAARDAAGTPAPSATATPTTDEIRAVVREELAREDRARVANANVVSSPAAPVVTTQTTEIRRTVQPAYSGYGSGVQGGLLYSGLTVNDGSQALFGLRLDFGGIAPGLRAIRLVPEIAVGVGGGGTSTYVAANALYEFGRIFRVRPRVALGAGLLNFSGPVGSRDGLDVVVTPAYGVSVPFTRLRRVGGIGTPELVVEHQGLGLFDLNRAVVGIGWRR